jgi:hypothetical protein
MAKSYYPYMADDTTLMANQVFVDGKMMIEARWPNVSDSDDLHNRNDFREAWHAYWSESGAQTLTDDAIPDIPGDWTGGTIWINGWYQTRTRDIIAQSGKTITMSGSLIGYKYRDYYYLTGRLGALDKEKEWFYDGTTLYLWAPDWSTPDHVEVKKRNYAFNLRGKSYITVRNIKIFAATITTNAGSTHIILDGIHAGYINHNVTVTEKDVIYSHTGQSDRTDITTGLAGIRLMGTNSVIKNSVVAYSSNMGIMLGTNCTAHNNLVHDIAYDGTYASAIAPHNKTNGQTITHNTMYRTGRSCIDILNSQNVEIGYNDMYHFGLLNVDMGCIYAARSSVQTGTEIHHNWIHDTKTIKATGINGGIYWDQNTGGVLVHHNVLWNNGQCDYLENNESSIYNNTFATEDVHWSNDVRWSYMNNSEDWYNDINELTRNNIFRDDFLYTTAKELNPTSIHSLYKTQDPQFNGTGKGGLKYRLQENSPAIDAGAVIPGVTDEYAGSAPDIGAYEYGRTEWIPGCGDTIIPVIDHYSVLVEFIDSTYGEPAEDLKVIFDRKDYVTDEDGIISLSGLTDGYYHLVIPDGHLAIMGTGIINVRSDSLFRITVRKLPVYSVQIQFVDSLSGKPFHNLDVMLDTLGYLTDKQGIVAVEGVTEGIHQVVLPDERFIITDKSRINVRSDSLFLVHVKKIPHLKIKLINRATGGSVYRAMVMVNEVNYYSDPSGFVTLGEWTAGPFSISVMHDDYFPVVDTLMFTRDTTMVLPMTSRRATVTFDISDAGGPLPGARVEVTGFQHTDAAGYAYFYFLPAREQYVYSVEKSGYTRVRDTFNLEVDTTLQVMLEEVTLVGDWKAQGIRITPNPFDSYIQVLARESSLLRLYDVSGVLRCSRKMEPGLNTLPADDLEDGGYIVRVITGDLEDGGYIVRVITGDRVFNVLIVKLSE